PNWCAHASRNGIRGTFRSELVEHNVCAPLAANHADIIRRGRDHGTQAVFVLLVAPRNYRYRNTSAIADCCAGSLRPIICQDQLDVILAWRTKQFAIYEFGTIVNERNAIADERGEPGERGAYMSGTTNDQARFGLDFFQQD